MNYAAACKFYRAASTNRCRKITLTHTPPRNTAPDRPHRPQKLSFQQPKRSENFIILPAALRSDSVPSSKARFVSFHTYTQPHKHTVGTYTHGKEMAAYTGKTFARTYDQPTPPVHISTGTEKTKANTCRSRATCNADACGARVPVNGC